MLGIRVRRDVWLNLIFGIRLRGQSQYMFGWSAPLVRGLGGCVSEASGAGGLELVSGRQKYIKKTNFGTATILAGPL